MTAVDGPYVRRRVAVAIGLLVVVLGLAWVASVSPIVAIERVSVIGTKQLSVAQVTTAGGIRRGDSLVWFRPGRAAGAIRSLPYVERVDVTRAWPHSVRIVVTERAPVAWFSSDGGVSTVDATGRVLARLAAAPVGLPQLLGLRRTAAPGGWIVPVAGATAAGQLTEATRATVPSVTSAADGALTMRTATGVEVRLGPPQRIGVKVRAAVAVLAALGDRRVTYVDVSVPTNPVAG